MGFRHLCRGVDLVIQHHTDSGIAQINAAGSDGGGQQVGRTVRPCRLRPPHRPRHDQRGWAGPQAIKGKCSFLNRVGPLDDDDTDSAPCHCRLRVAHDLSQMRQG